MFVFLLIALVVVVAAVTLAVIGSGDSADRGASGGLAGAPPDLLDEPLPPDRPVGHADVAALRLPVGVRGYRMQQVDDVLDRLGAELAERDSRIAELESALAGAQAVAMHHEAGSGERLGGRQEGGQAGQTGQDGQAGQDGQEAPREAGPADAPGEQGGTAR